MRIVASVFGMFLASVSWVSAQVTVELLLEQDQFLRDESMPIKVRVVNRSGQTLALGREAEWLVFHVANRDESLVDKLADVPLGQEFSLESATAANKTMDLMPFFDLSQPGAYTVSAQIRVKEWNQEFVSPPKSFEIVRGASLWDQEVGVPAAGGVPEVRKFTLQQATYRKQFQLYARVTDVEERKVFKVLRLGQLVSFSHPEAQVDKESRLHVLFQTGARAFIYCVVSVDGAIVAKQTHDYTQTRPTLKSADDGRIIVAGGVRRALPSDLPPPAPTGTSTNEVKAPKS